ncbi:haloacid dehalogenase [Lactobacillus crispatus]|uniref:heavy metal translocating P-type ATPase n=1 Tax=Lactobacillus crispatus TaxID=47770 RepID=UPI0018E2E4D7|nr:heavy metal translocating P-type ATPase [Lactobacillus crispatus]MBI1697513.1 haloacid dehalogenase [Lactobacillus crispatus]MBI1699446.1 haloacid dehalogenase [Lactobacillus crispatus]MBI1721227.1 haloacid dehalogenase [Lactobacillus crispatus]
MIKVQRFFIKYKKQILLLNTILLLLAEGSKWLLHLNLPYQLLMLVVGIIGVIPIVLTAISSIKVKLISIDVLVSLAVLGAFIIGEFNEAAIVTWLFMLGDFLEEVTLKKTRSAISDLTKMAPTTALVMQDDGSTKEEDVDFIDPGTRILVKTGDQIPVDGKIVSGSGYLNEASINGESSLANKKIGNQVYAGTILEDGTLTIETIAAGEDTTFGKIIEMVEEAQDTKSHAEKLINRFSKYYTPAVLVIAIIVGLITRDLKLAITVMVLGCPGALIIGVPVSTVAGIGNGAKNGIIFKGSQVMDQTRKIDEIAFDKTGTLTVGHPEVSAIKILKGQRNEIIRLAAQIEQQSNHPLAQAIAKLDNQASDVIKVETAKGKGLIATISGEKYYLGNQNLITENTHLNQELLHTINHLSNLGNSIVVFANADQSQLAVFGIKDQLRPEAKIALTRLKKLGVKKLVMLSGDNFKTAKQVAAELPIDEVYGEMLPADKAAFVKKEQEKGYHVAFIGDGINDSPALANADVAIAIGSGTDVAIDVSDIVLVKNDLRKVSYAIDLAKKTVLNMNENIAIALLTVLLLFIGLFAGYVEMASGMFIHEFSILVVILNGMRLIRFKQKLDHHQVSKKQIDVALNM